MILDKENQLNIELIGESSRQPSKMRYKLLASTVVALAAFFIAFQTVSNGSDELELQNPTTLTYMEINLGEWQKLTSFGLFSTPIRSLHVSPKGDIYVLQDQPPNYRYEQSSLRRYSFKYDSFEGAVLWFLPRSLEAKIFLSYLLSEKYVALVRADNSVLNKRSLEGEPFSATRLCYRASQDGFSCDLFSSQCRDKGPSVTIVKTTKGKVFGGYNPISWQNTPLRPDSTPRAFVFILDRGLILRSRYPKSPSIKNTCCGPSFDIDFTLDLNFPESQYTRFGSTYNGINYFSLDAESFLAGEPNYHLADVEVYTLS
ncbi:UNKNOWN [Stylonychia lemnae]|uniref:TLDc domain-containing protein n=1 Tax=Stylonychia lemnae TaxID=5949 RepID=A0A078AIV8_STYLE|nr:UNKNOWN [Stylonychia lemnae]|eukprot:CDW81382.1 UNKNOWN [Stylonychia lemnae]